MNLDMALIWRRYGLEVLYQCDKRVKIKVRKVEQQIPMFREVTGEKIVVGLF